MYACLLALTALQQSLAPLHVDGANLKTPDGQVVQLRGCNLGNWFIIEHWIWDENQPEGSSHDQYDLEQLLTKRFGEEEKDRLMDLYRSNWITERDFKIIQSFRFNCVRLPLNYRMFEDDDKPFHLKPNPWKWTDRAVKLAEKHGIYVILDMHGVQGGQNDYDHSGRQHQNKLWTTPEDQERMAWLWTQVAKHYRNQPAVMGYDLFNEPYGGEKAQIRQVWEKTYRAVRTVDPDKLVYAMGRYDGFDMYGDPKANGWNNVGIEMHYYPGLFGNGPGTERTNILNMMWLKRVVVPQVNKLNVPFLVGEMNVVFKAAGGAQMMRRTYDSYAENGWGTTMWTYKALSRGGGYGDANWGMVTNKEPIPEINFATSSESAIEAFFKSHGTMPYAINEDLRNNMVPEHVDLPTVDIGSVRTTAPQDSLAGWTGVDIDGALPGGLELTSDGFNLFGGGGDIWGDRDQFRFLSQEATGDFDLQVQVNSEENLGDYCKAGLMVRGSLDPQAPMAMLSVFPSGDVQTAVRTDAGGSAKGAEARHVGFPMQMRIVRQAGVLACSYRKVGDATWTDFPLPAAPNLGQKVSCGAIALSHDDSQLIKVGYAHLTLRNPLENR